MTNGPPAKLLLANACLADGRTVDVTIADERISAVTAPGELPLPAGAERIDCSGHLLTPSFVEGHIHLDKTLLGLPLVPHRTGGSVADRIKTEKELRATLDLGIEARGSRLVEQVVGFGTGALRTHVDIDTDVGLSGLEAVIRLRESYRDLVDMEIVAFPQSGILRDPGTADLLDAALAAGADLVGGLDPAGIDGDIDAHLGIVFSLAERHGMGVDIHLHDPGPLGAFELRTIAERTRAAGLQGRVAVSHAYALGAIDEAEFGRTAEALARAEVAIMTNAPGTGPMPPVLRLAAAGVTVFAGSDNIRDAWWPYFDGDMLDRAYMVGYQQGFYTNADLAYAFAMATEFPARVLGRVGYGVEIGGLADLVLLAAPAVPEAVLDRPRGRTVVKHGRIVVRNGAIQSNEARGEVVR